MKRFQINGTTVLAPSGPAAARAKRDYDEQRATYRPATHRPFARLGDALQVAQSTGREVVLTGR